MAQSMTVYSFERVPHAAFVARTAKCVVCGQNLFHLYIGRRSSSAQTPSASDNVPIENFHVNSQKS